MRIITDSDDNRIPPEFAVIVSHPFVAWFGNFPDGKWRTDYISVPQGESIAEEYLNETIDLFIQQINLIRSKL